jgi:hypothetical protein
LILHCLSPNNVDDNDGFSVIAHSMAGRGRGSLNYPPGMRRPVTATAPTGSSNTSIGMSDAERRLRQRLAELCDGDEDEPNDDDELDVLSGTKPITSSYNVPSKTSAASTAEVVSSDQLVSSGMSMMDMLSMLNAPTRPLGGSNTDNELLAAPIHDRMAMINQCRQGAESYDTATLMARRPFMFSTPNKQSLYKMCTPPSSPYPHRYTV